MPRFVKRFDKLSGPDIVLVYDEREMADALDISIDDLLEALRNGQLNYYAHPHATGSGYEFQTQTYKDNILIWECLQSGGHDWQPSSKSRHHKCLNCPATIFRWID